MPSNLNPKSNKLAATLTIGSNRYGIGPTGKLYIYTSSGWEHFPRLKTSKPGVVIQLKNLLKEKRAKNSSKSKSKSKPRSMLKSKPKPKPRSKSKTNSKSKLGLVEIEPLFIVRYGKNKTQYTQQGNGFVYAKYKTKWKHVKKQNLPDALVELLNTEFSKHYDSKKKKTSTSLSKPTLTENEVNEMKKEIIEIINNAIKDVSK